MLFSDDSGLTGLINRALERAAQNLTIEKALINVGLDPNNLTLEAIVQRVLDFAVANVNVAGMFALFGAIFFVVRLLMKTMVPTRVFGIISSLFLLIYGVLSLQVAHILQNLFALPIDILRLFQMLGLVKKARVAAQGDLSMEWLKPFMSRRTYKTGDVLFRKGQLADEMFFTVTGKYLVSEIGVEVPPGQMIGELGFLTPNNKRTATIECIESGAVLTISYEQLLEIYFENPEFGYYFLRLASNRLLQNIARLEGIIEQNKSKMAASSVTEAKAISALDVH